jgi:ABC-type nitrate/sulfonate/bicarbonate transport system substrate-binding protein
MNHERLVRSGVMVTILLACALAVSVGGAQAPEPVTLRLDWTVLGQHAPTIATRT